MEDHSFLTPVERRKVNMKLAIAVSEQAGNGASLIIGLGEKLLNDMSEFDEVLQKVTNIIDRICMKPKQRIYTSYSLLLFATL